MVCTKSHRLRISQLLKQSDGVGRPPRKRECLSEVAEGEEGFRVVWSKVLSVKFCGPSEMPDRLVTFAESTVSTTERESNLGFLNRLAFEHFVNSLIRLVQ